MEVGGCLERVFRVEGQSVALDSQGNQYVAGKFIDTAAFGSHNLT